MRILFLVYHGFSDHSGISKKIHSQVKGLRENGHEVRLCYYGFAENGHKCRYVDDTILKDYGTGRIAAIRQRVDYKCIYDYCIREKIEFIYARSFMNASPWLTNLFKKFQHAGIHAVTEIPTYPYDSEFSSHIWRQPFRFIVDKRFRHSLYRYMDAMVTFSDAKEIFGQRTINISNGVDFDSIPLHEPNIVVPNNQLHLIGVAEVHIWHAYDRLIAGLGEYYRNGGQRDVIFHIVGGVHPHQMYEDCAYHPGFKNIIDKYGIQDKVVFHGQLFGDKLTDVFNQCQFAIGSLGRHRSGITVIKTLKNREYATRGMPFVYSEQDSDFDQQPYVLKVPADESPVDIQQIIDFMNHFTMKPEDIRKTVEHLKWKTQMQRVLDAIFL
ncbi:MAG: glycosyltransferase family 1 protein [Prevotella sp.]|nr:glycosyltransferase family 1 protein [Prevotella sp.]MBO7128492.1 glycosyltransferase family 1 protein [Prevotella sp.]